MNNSVLALLIGMGVFACTSTDKAVSVKGKDAGSDGGAGRYGTLVCDESACEGRMYKGQVLETCCFSDKGCGVIVNGTCTAPILIADRDASSSSPFGTGETVVLDPSCPDQTITMGQTLLLKGCCDKTGVCGASTAALAANGAPIPAMCISPKEATAFGQRPEAGAERSCNYPSDGGVSSDAAAHD